MRGQDTRATRWLREIVDDDDDLVLVGDLILLEVLQGARDDTHAARIERYLRCYPVAPMLDPTIAVQAAQYFRLLRGRGITIRKTIDLIIGTFCIRGGHTLLHADRDFDPMAEHLGLHVMRV